MTELGLRLQFECAGAPRQLKLTLPVSPSSDANVIVNVAECPEEIVCDVGDIEIVKFPTEKLPCTGMAAAYTPLPDCEACMVQVPSPLSDAFEPETKHTVGVREVKVTVNPELAEA